MEAMMVKIQINGTVYEADKSRNLLQVCLGLGFDIPHFCFHPAMGSVGACRLCAVKKHNNADDKKGRIIMSCMEPVTEGMIITTDDPEIKAFRAAVTEALMTNHPHDCPICDEGGECHLQDMTVMTGHNYRRFIFRKRTHRNQYLGPFINHEMNRCIQCYRCVRFYRDYAGGTDLSVYGSANRVYFGRQSDGVLENEFSGNLIEVCPTGVFTDKTLKNHYTRKWDLTNSPSVCVHCSLGCNIIVSERYGSVRRILSRHNSEINGYFICDRGRFGYEFLNDAQRIKETLVKNASGEDQVNVPDKELQLNLVNAIKGKNIIGIGSPRASVESNHALEILAGKDNFFHGISREEYSLTRTAIDILKSGVAHSPSLKDVEKSDAIFIFGEDIINTAPMLALSVRQASRNRSLRKAESNKLPLWNDAPVRELAQQTKSPVFIASPFSTRLDGLAEQNYFGTPDDIARLGFKVASLIDNSSPAPRNSDARLEEYAGRIADALSNAENPVIITGLHMRNKAMLLAAANICLALSGKGKKPSLSIVFPESNSLGLGLLDGHSFEDLQERKIDHKADTLIILENDIYLRITSEKADAFLKKFQNIIVIDHIKSRTSAKADVVLPAGSFAESTGTIINNEGRAQRYYRVIPDHGSVKDSWKHLGEIIKLRDGKEESPWNNHDEIAGSCTASYPFFRKIEDGIPGSDFRIFNEKIARQTHRSSGRTAMNANVSVSEPRPPQDNDSPFAFSMEGFKGIPPKGLEPYYWSPGWNSVQAMYKYENAYPESDDHNVEGVLLFDKLEGRALSCSNDIPGPFIHEPGRLLLVPSHLIFGSEELSALSRPVRERIPEPYILINKKEMENLQAVEGDMAEISVMNTLIKARIKRDEKAADGVAGLSLIMDGSEYIELPAMADIHKI